MCLSMCACVFEGYSLFEVPAGSMGINTVQRIFAASHVTSVALLSESGRRSQSLAQFCKCLSIQSTSFSCWVKYGVSERE